MSAPGDLEGRGLRVATFNMRAAIGPGPFPDRWWRRCDPGRLERIAGVIRELDADVVALQEVALLAIDGDVVNQAAELGRLTGHAHRYGAVRTWTAHEPDGICGGGLFGNALLARGEVHDSRVLALPRAPDTSLVEAPGDPRPWAGLRYADAPPTIREPRCAVFASVDTTAGAVRVLSAHLSHVGSGERRLQADALVASDAELVLGDLNSWLELPELAPFADWTDAFAAVDVPPGDERRRSTDDGWPIDQVLLRPSSAWRVASCEVIRAAGDASDHYPVVATLLPADNR